MTTTAALPQKKYYRQRAHSNPLSDHTFDYPISPDDIDWCQHYPLFPVPPPPSSDSPASQVIDNNSQLILNSYPEFVDMGCGYGGLLMSLSTRFPNTKILGLEIRVKVYDYVQDKIKALRSQEPGLYNNIAILRTNAMKYMPNYFNKGQLSKMFFLFPDPHFKKSKHKWRIISTSLLAEYAYCMKIGGLVYTATDVQDLHQWMRDHFVSHPLFEEIEEKERDSDEVVPLLSTSTEEGKKVARSGNPVYIAVFRRIEDGFQPSDGRL